MYMTPFNQSKVSPEGSRKKGRPTKKNFFEGLSGWATRKKTFFCGFPNVIYLWRKLSKVKKTY